MFLETFPVVEEQKTNISHWHLTVVRVDDLEVFDGGLCDTAVEVQHVRVGLFVPAGGFVHQGHQVVCVAVLVADQKSLNVLKGQHSYGPSEKSWQWPFVYSVWVAVLKAELRFREHTLFGRMHTRSSFSIMPGMITVIFLGPLKPKTFFSWNMITHCVTWFIWWCMRKDV